MPHPYYLIWILASDQFKSALNAAKQLFLILITEALLRMVTYK
jgi:hypothetical protein